MIIIINIIACNFIYKQIPPYIFLIWYPVSFLK